MDQAGVSPEDIIELEWWEGVRVSKTSKRSILGDGTSQKMLPKVEGLVHHFSKSSNGVGSGRGDDIATIYGKNEMVITCAPAQHWSSRTPFDRNRRLWCSWAVHATPSVTDSTDLTNHFPHQQLHKPTSQIHSFYFAGDTGFPAEFPLHHQIGDRLGPFDLAAIPIGAYEPEWFMREAHCNPVEAVKIHRALRSRRSVAMHFDTFDLADEPREEPPRLLLEEVDRVNEKILKMAVEVAAVADEVGIAKGLEVVEDKNGNYEEERNAATSISLEEDVITRVGEKLVELIPPLVEFEVIEQGQSIESLPRIEIATSNN